MLKIILNSLVAIILFCACVPPIPIKNHPDYTGVDPRVKPLVDEFLWLSGQNNIKFTDTVTIGFKKIEIENIVGLTTYTAFFREIDIDINYWNHSTNASKLALLFHELIHAYCGRGHDYGENLVYPSPTEIQVEDLKWSIKAGHRDGYRDDDGCPLSIMYPIVLPDSCTLTHYQEYTKEMFYRCNPF